MKKIILGIDPGLENTGWGIISQKSHRGGQAKSLKLESCGVILTNNRHNIEDRLEKIYNELEEIIKKYRVTEMAIESLFFAKNAKSALKVAEAIGVIRVCGRKNSLKVAEYTPLQVKMALVGFGRAEKEQVEIMVKNELEIEGSISPSHAADAVAVALTHSFTMKIEN